MIRDWNLPWFGGALIGAFAGLIMGVFGSGIYLMVYRALQHLKGDHK
jgi:ABC-type microcin C transport system permease subunit YejE